LSPEHPYIFSFEVKNSKAGQSAQTLSVSTTFISEPKLLEGDAISAPKHALRGVAGEALPMFLRPMTFPVRSVVQTNSYPCQLNTMCVTLSISVPVRDFEDFAATLSGFSGSSHVSGDIKLSSATADAAPPATDPAAEAPKPNKKEAMKKAKKAEVPVVAVPEVASPAAANAAAEATNPAASGCFAAWLLLITLPFVAMAEYWKHACLLFMTQIAFSRIAEIKAPTSVGARKKKAKTKVGATKDAKKTAKKAAMGGAGKALLLAGLVVLALEVAGCVWLEPSAKTGLVDWKASPVQTQESGWILVLLMLTAFGVLGVAFVAHQQQKQRPERERACGAAGDTICLNPGEGAGGEAADSRSCFGGGVAPHRTLRITYATKKRGLLRLLEMSDSRAGILISDISLILLRLLEMSNLFCDVSSRCS